MNRKLYMDNYNKTHKITHAKSMGKWYIRNKKRALMHGKKWRESHKEYCKEYQRNKWERFSKESPWNRHYIYGMSRCTWKNCSYYRKGIRFLLTLEQVKSLWFRDKAYLLKKPSLDRIDSDKNYTYKNCRFIEWLDNIKRPKTRTCWAIWALKNQKDESLSRAIKVLERLWRKKNVN